jgi:hypothetical protein
MSMQVTCAKRMPEPRRHKTGWPSTTSAARYNASLLDAPSVKGALQAAQAPLVLVVSAGLDGFVHTGESGRALSPVSVQVAGDEYEGRVSLLPG